MTVSVIIPAYNCEKQIVRVLYQLLPDIMTYIEEVIVINNRSTDGTEQAVLDYIDKMPSELTADGRRMIRRRTLEEYISDTLPPVTPQPKMGRWIEERTYIECSNCHDIWHYEENQTERFKFCPTCGGRNK